MVMNITVANGQKSAIASASVRNELRYLIRCIVPRLKILSRYLSELKDLCLKEHLGRFYLNNFTA